jgi:hypothetical protein
MENKNHFLQIKKKWQDFVIWKSKWPAHKNLKLLVLWDQIIYLFEKYWFHSSEIQQKIIYLVSINSFKLNDLFKSSSKKEVKDIIKMFFLIKSWLFNEILWIIWYWYAYFNMNHQPVVQLKIKESYDWNDILSFLCNSQFLFDKEFDWLPNRRWVKLIEWDFLLKKIKWDLLQYFIELRDVHFIHQNMININTHCIDYILESVRLSDKTSDTLSIYNLIIDRLFVLCKKKNNIPYIRDIFIHFFKIKYWLDDKIEFDWLCDLSSDVQKKYYNLFEILF